MSKLLLSVLWREDEDDRLFTATTLWCCVWWNRAFGAGSQALHVVAESATIIADTDVFRTMEDLILGSSSSLQLQFYWNEVK